MLWEVQIFFILSKDYLKKIINAKVKLTYPILIKYIADVTGKNDIPKNIIPNFSNIIDLKMKIRTLTR